MSDILIKNMELSDNCKVCRFVCYENIYEKPYCPFLPHIKTDPKSRLAECPLEALLDHGDLIDRGILTEILEKEIRLRKDNADEAMLLKGVLYEILKAPVVIPRSGS